MASPRDEIESTNTLQLEQLFRNISSKFSLAESEDVVQSLKRNYGGKFNLLHDQDLLSCLQLLERHGYVNDNKLSLVEEFVAPKSNKEELIKETIESFKTSLQGRVEPRKELQGRQDEIEKITKNLETGKSFIVVNLFGSAGVGKTTLANEVCSRWSGKHFVFDLREAKDIRAIYFNMMNSLGLNVPVGYVDQNYVVTKIYEKIEPLKSDGQPVLFLLDNVEQFTSGQGKEGKNLRTAFVQFLEKLLDFDGKDKKTLKLLLTSRTQLLDAKKVDNFEVRSLGSSFSEKILVSKLMVSVNTHQKNQLIDISKGIPLLLKGIAAILRQERKSADDLIVGVHKGKLAPPEKSKSEEDAKEKPFNFEEEGVDVGQLSAIRQMFDTLSTDSLKVSAVSISLFCGPFSASTAAKVLGISLSEALVQLEGLVTSAIIFVVDEEAKERMYDIHPLLKKYADSIKDDAEFQRAYLEAKGRFHQHFMTKMEKIAKLIEPDYVRAFRLFESDRPNYEFTVDISLQPEYFSVPGEYNENALIASLFTAMLTEDKQIKLFHTWAAMCEDDGNSGSLCRAQLKCWEARQVSDAEGTERAFEVMKEASCSLAKVQDKSSESYRLSKGLYLYSEGEITYRNREYKKALKSLESSLQFTEELLEAHTDLARCYNAIGNCHFKLNKPMKALEFYNRAYQMQKQLAGSEYHFDMPTYKNQIGTVFEGQKDYDKAVECYKEALRLLDELKLSGFWDEALFQRNLANALLFQKKYLEAVEPADRAYSIRVKVLGNHPLTVRSIYQRAVIQANIGEKKKAFKLFLEAWEMEKSLGAGNHSEVWRKIIAVVEDMYGEQFLPSFFSKKEQFKKDALKFCQRFWDEQKLSAQFGFTEYNKEIIDAILYLLGDKKAKYEATKDALWFYDGMQNVTEKEFQEEFDQETESSVLNKMLKERDEIFDKVIELCLQLGDQEKLTKYKNIKLALYEKVLIKPDFVGEKDYAYDKAKLKSEVEQLYQDVGQKENIAEFRENLLRAWQKQWEEGKGREKTKEFGVARERIINGILQLCKELKKEEMFRTYGKEALSFYENIWEAKYSKMRPPEMKKFLRYIKQIASSIGYHERKKCYHEAYQDLQDGKQPEATLCSQATEIVQIPLAKDVSSKSAEKVEEEEEEEIEVGSGDETDRTLPINKNKKTLIRKAEVSHEGDSWNLKEAAALITFHPGAVIQPLLITCSLWSPRTLSPPLSRNEALVSNVIELSHDGPPELEFSGDAKGNITVALLHSASNLKGYEVVIKQLVDPENNEWKDLETKNIWHTSEKPAAPNWLFPLAEASCTITRCSSFACIRRLKTFISSQPKSVTTEFLVPDYPDDSVEIPCISVPADKEFCLKLKDLLDGKQPEATLCSTGNELGKDNTMATAKENEGNAEAVGIVNYEGGVVVAGDVQVICPYGAIGKLEDHVTIKITLEKPSTHCDMIVKNGLENNVMFIAPVINLQPNGQVFRQPVTVTAKLSIGKEASQSDVLILHGAQASDGKIIWQDITQKSKIDLEKKEMEVEIHEFSRIAALLRLTSIFTKHIVTRLNLTGFHYTLSVLFKGNHPYAPYGELALVFMSHDVYHEKDYREHPSAVLMQLKSNGFEKLCSIDRLESKRIYNNENLKVSVSLGQDYMLTDAQLESTDIVVETSTWWSIGHVIKLSLKGTDGGRILCGRIGIEGQYGHVLGETFCELDSCEYVWRLLRAEGSILNLVPIAQKLEVPVEAINEAIKAWKKDEEQLKIILQHWSKVQDDRSKEDPAVLRNSLKGLNPEDYEVDERGEMHINHLRELAFEIQGLNREDRHFMEYFTNEERTLCDFILKDCCIEIDAEVSTENYPRFLSRRQRITEDVAMKLEEICSSSTRSINEDFFSILPFLIQAIKEIFRKESPIIVQNGLKGLPEEIVSKHDSEVRDAFFNQNILRLVCKVCNVLENLCLNNCEKHSTEVIENWSESLGIWNMSEFLKKFFQGRQDGKLHKRLQLFSRSLRRISEDVRKVKEIEMRYLYNIALNLIKFATFDPSKLVRFEMTDSTYSPVTCNSEAIKYDSPHDTYSQQFEVRKESDHELELGAIAHVHLDGRIRKVGAYESVITLPSSSEEKLSRCLMTPFPVTVKRRRTDSGNLRVVLSSTHKKSISEALSLLRRELGDDIMDGGQAEIKESPLMVSCLSEYVGEVKLRLLYKWWAEAISVDSKDFVAIAESSATDAYSIASGPDSTSPLDAELTALSIPSPAGERYGNFVMDPWATEMVQRHARQQCGRLEIHLHQTIQKGHVCVTAENTTLNVEMPNTAPNFLQKGLCAPTQKSITAGPSSNDAVLSEQEKNKSFDTEEIDL